MTAWQGWARAVFTTTVDQRQLQVELFKNPLSRVKGSTGIQPFAQAIAIEIRRRLRL